MNPEAALVQASVAWQNLLEAERQLARLAGYRHMSPAMKDDRNRWDTKASAARATLNQILNRPMAVAA